MVIYADQNEQRFDQIVGGFRVVSSRNHIRMYIINQYSHNISIIYASTVFDCIYIIQMNIGNQFEIQHNAETELLFHIIII